MGTKGPLSVERAIKMNGNALLKKLKEGNPSPEEKAQALELIRQLEDVMEIPHEEPSAEPVVSEVVAHEPSEEVVPEAPSPNGRLRDLSDVRARLERRRKNIERQLDRGENTFTNAIELDNIDLAIEMTYEAEKIPAIRKRYGCMNRGETVELDGYQPRNPIVFRDWTYETSDPMQIAYIERRIRMKEEADNHPTMENQHLRSAARIMDIGNREPMVNWEYTRQFAGFKTPEDAEFEEKMQQQIRVSKRMQRLRA